MNSYRVNTNYAKALFLLATDRGQTDRVADDMKLIGDVMAENHELSVVMGNPTLRYDKKKSVMDALFGNRVCDETAAFLAFVIKKNRSVNLHGISEAYLNMWRDSRGIVRGDLVSHLEADEDAREQVRRLIAEYTGKEVELHTTTDPNMLGGFKMEFDHNMYDARLRTKIRKLRKAFSDNEYESKL